VVIGPTGDPVSEVMRDAEGILYAEIDTAACVEPKQFHDVVGGYNRFDVFQLRVNRAANRPVTFVETEPTPRGEDDRALRAPPESEPDWPA
jgi:aliphatic nitrilase